MGISRDFQIKWESLEIRINWGITLHIVGVDWSLIHFAVIGGIYL